MILCRNCALDHMKLCGITSTHQVLDNEASISYREATQQSGMTYKWSHLTNTGETLQKSQYKRGNTTSKEFYLEWKNHSPCICGAKWHPKQKDNYYCCAKHTKIQMYPRMPTSKVPMTTVLNILFLWEWKPWSRRNPIFGKLLHHNVSRTMYWELPLNTIAAGKGGWRKHLHQKYQGGFFQTQIYNQPHVYPWRCHHSCGSKYCISPPRKNVTTPQRIIHPSFGTPPRYFKSNSNSSITNK